MKKLAGCAAVLVIAAIAVVLTWVGPFWSVIALFVILAAVITIGLAVDLRRERDTDKAGAGDDAASADREETAA